MLLARFAGRHWLAIAFVAGVIPLVIAGAIGRDLGLYFLFRNDPPIESLPGWSIIGSRPFLTGFYLSYLISFLFCFFLAEDAIDRNDAAGKRAWLDADVNPPRLMTILQSALPFVLLPVAAYNFPLADDIAPPLPVERWENALGAAVGLLPVSLIVLVSSSAFAHWRLASTSHGRVLFSPRSRIAGMLLMMLIVNALFDATYSFASLINLAGWGLLVYLFWNVLADSQRSLAIVALAGVLLGSHAVGNWLGSRNGEDWKSDYRAPISVSTPPGPTSDTSLAAGLVDPVAALEGWRKSSGAGEGEKPKLVILATSGGGYRATFWAAHVIDKLREESLSGRNLPGLVDSVRLVTGASGGMVASAYFVAQQQGACGASKETRIVDQIRRDVAGYYANAGYFSELGNDSLSAVARQWVKADLFGIGPGRSQVLEAQWLSLCSPLTELSEAERDGRAPSFIISPTVVEDGRPLFISNLDLSHIATHAAWDFSRMFPDGRQKLSLKTAVRMNATFPYITPAETLPTRPRMRVVDAGYSDNFGVNAAVAYLLDPRIKSWIEANVSGVILIEIWSFPENGLDVACNSSTEPAAAGKVGNQDALKEASAEPAILERISEPFAAIFAVRETGMVARNRQLLTDAISRYPHGMIRHVVIENRVKASLSWYLPGSELNCLLSQWRSDIAPSNLGSLIKAWGRD